MDDWRLGCRDKGLKFGVWAFGRVGEWEGEVVGKPGDSVALLCLALMGTGIGQVCWDIGQRDDAGGLGHGTDLIKNNKNSLMWQFVLCDVLLSASVLTTSRDLELAAAVSCQQAYHQACYDRLLLCLTHSDATCSQEQPSTTTWRNSCCTHTSGLALASVFCSPLKFITRPKESKRG